MPTSKKESVKQEPKKENSTQAEYRKLYRSEKDKVIAGVAGGLGEYFNMDPTIVRVLFVILTIFGGSGIIIYIVLWLVMPTESSNSALTSESVKSNIEDIKFTTQTFAHKIRGPKDTENSKFWWAMMIIAVGFLFLLNNYGILAPVELERLWPLILILFGLAILLRK